MGSTACCESVFKKEDADSVVQTTGDKTEGAAKKNTGNPAKPKLRDVPPEETAKIHSTIRWAKADWKQELTKLIYDDAALASEDENNGNYPIHIASQNGHIEICNWLINKKCDVNVQNGTGATPLHMAVAYDFYPVCKLLLEKGAQKDLKNKAGNDAITGLEGDKVNDEAWDSPLTMLNCATDLRGVEEALKKIEEDPSKVDKANLAKVGLRKKKDLGTDWPQARFMKIMQSI